jgi:hypothetical protein
MFHVQGKQNNSGTVALRAGRAIKEQKLVGPDKDGLYILLLMLSSGFGWCPLGAERMVSTPPPPHQSWDPRVPKG